LRRGLRWFIFSTGGLAVPVLLLVLGLMLLLATEGGSRWLIGQVLPRLPVEVGVEQTSGTLMRGLSLRGFSLRQDGMDLRIDSLAAQWRLRDLLSGRFVLRSLQVEDIDLTLAGSAPAAPPSEPGAWPDLGVGLPLRIVDASIVGIHIHQPEGDFHLEQVRLSASQGPLNTRIDRLQVRHQGFSLALAGRARNRPPYAMDLRLDLKASLPLVLLQDSNSTPVADSPATTDAGPAQQIDGYVRMQGGLDRPEIEIVASLPVQASFKGTIDTGFDPDILQVDPQRLQVTGELRWPDQQLPPAWVQLPLQSAGSLELEGRLDDYRVSGATHLVTPGYPAADLELQLAGDTGGISVDSLRLNTGSGRLQAKGDLQWRQTLQWAFDLETKDIDPAVLLPDWPARIDARLHTSGSLPAEGLQLAVDLQSLSGTVREQPLLGSGQFSYSPAAVSGREIHLVVDQNRLDASGRLALAAETEKSGSGALALQWRLELGNPGLLVPGLGGQLLSAGEMSGTLSAPVVQAELSASGISFAENGVEQLQITVTPDAARAGRHQVSVSGAGVNVPGLVDAAVSLDWRGDPGAHALNLKLDSPGYKASLAALGGWRQNRWSGNLQELALQQVNAGRWLLDQPAALELGATAARLGEACLRQVEPPTPVAKLDTRSRRQVGQDSGAAEPPPAREWLPGNLCLGVAWSSAAGLEASGRLSSLDLGMLQPWLPLATELRSSLNGNFSLAGPIAQLQGKVSLAAGAGDFLYYGDDGEVDRYPFAGFSVDADLAPAQWQARLEGHLPFDGLLASSMVYFPDQGTVSGDLAMDFSSLAWVGPFVPSLDDLGGSFSSRLHLDGSISTPEITGFLRLQDFAAQVPGAAIKVSDGHLQVSREPAAPWQIAGGLRSGKGAIDLNGSVDWHWQQPWQATLKVAGNDFQIVDLPDLAARADPNVTIVAGPEALRLEGELGIPSASVTIKKLPETAVSVSEDTVLLESAAGENDRPDKEVKGPYPVYSDLRLALGKDVKFSGFGIKAGLEGSLQLQERPGKPTQVDGEVDIIDGSYKAYGQLFEIEEGRLIFRGSPENPGLWVRAVRYYEDTKVGILIRGTAKALRSEVFSEPAMPSSEAMAILITGKPLESANKSDANRLVNAATALGISQSKYVTERLQRTFGLDVLKLSSEAGLEQSSLTVGKYLSPRLYVSYVRDLFGDGFLVNLDYRIGRHLKLRAETGATQGVDVFYSFDR